MAKKKNTEDTGNNNKSKSGSFLTDERFRIALGFLVSGFAVLLFISFISYLFTWKTDQSFQWSRVFSEADYTVDNWSGKLGAYFSNLFMNHWFGITSVAVPFVLLLMGFSLMKVRIKNLWFITRVAIAGMILFSISMARCICRYPGNSFNPGCCDTYLDGIFK
jgi:S-DNA-T family DNA segregation ATPase FtsK/SpoIIIE